MQLIDAIEAAKDGTGETEYLRFRCFRNRNLHLEFKRLDLVAKLNAISAGMRLRSEPKDQRSTQAEVSLKPVQQHSWSTHLQAHPTPR